MEFFDNLAIGFDLEQSYLEPFQYSAGVVHVVVNGRLVLDDGRPTDARPGRSLRRAH